MAAVDDPKSLGRARLTFANEAEIDAFAEMLGRFERREIGPDQWRAFRLAQGTYGQRQDAVHMIRAKIPQGVLDVRQLEALADVADRFSRGFAHVTTRQNVQFHFVQPHDLEPAMRVLADAGLTTREACGNSVRNVTGCPYAGVAEDEVFDVTPYAEALTRHLLRHPLSAALPRKFKIAFEGCATDHVVTGINDLGFRARLGPSGERGFRVTAGGGTAIMCTSGRVLCEFLPAAEILEGGEAVVRVFHRLGDYTHRQRNRMKFMIKDIGWDRFVEAFEAARGDIRNETRALSGMDGLRLPFDPESPPIEEAPDWDREAAPAIADVAVRASAAAIRGPGLTPESSVRLMLLDEPLAAWLTTNVRRQKQRGYSVVAVRLPLGDVTAAQLRILADVAAAYGDGAARTTPDQNIVLRWVRASDVIALHRRLAAAGLALSGAGTLADVTSCPGAETCRLAVTQSRGLARVLTDALRDSPELVEAATDAGIKISGCPNGCGQHHVAAIGFQGSVRKVGGRAVPQYFVLVGGRVGDDRVEFGRLAAKIPARRISEAVARLVSLFCAARGPGERAVDFFARVEIGRVRGVLADLERFAPQEIGPDDYVDIGEEAEFAPEVLEGECSA
jgi:sulfite reductase (NADPH) hemoprotein beta-component